MVSHPTFCQLLHLVRKILKSRKSVITMPQPMLPSLPTLLSILSCFGQFTVYVGFSSFDNVEYFTLLFSFCFFCVLNIWKQIYKLIKVEYIWFMLVLSWGLLSFPTVSREKWETDCAGQTQTMVIGFHGSQKELRLYFCIFSNKHSHIYSHENVAFKVHTCVYLKIRRDRDKRRSLCFLR